MNLRNAVVAATLIVTGAAFAQENTDLTTTAPAVDPKTTLEMGDLPGNAYTTRAGTFLLHPFLPSSYAISDTLEVKTSLLGLIAGPNVGVEYKLLSDSDHALSIEPRVGATWSFASFSAGATARYSRRVGGSNYFSANVGGDFSRFPGTTANPAGTNVITVPVSLAFSIQSSPHTIWDIHAGTNVLNFLPGGFASGSVGFTWFHSFGGMFQLGLGIELLMGAVPSQIRDFAALANITLPAFLILPLPDVTLGFKF